MPEIKSLADQVIVVTGASSGPGRAVARLAGRHGAKVVVTARGSEALDACVREIEASGSEALAVPADCAVGRRRRAWSILPSSGSGGSPEPFAEAVLRCCEHPVRELPVGWGAQKLMW